MKTKKTLALILVLLVPVLFKGVLFAQSTQKFETVKVSEGEKKYAASLLLEDADLNEIVTILSEYTGAQIKVEKPPSKNKKLRIEIHFDDAKEANRLVWYGTDATLKTYVTDNEEVKNQEITINTKDNTNAEGQIRIRIKLGDRIRVDYQNISLEELLDRFGELGETKFKLDDELKGENIRVNLKMENFTLDEALKALAGLENLAIIKLDEHSFLITKKK
jgi:hypothetical protein